MRVSAGETSTDIPPSRPSSVRLRGADDDRLPYALVDVVTADFSKDPRYEGE
jgi:hypothetical protein